MSLRLFLILLPAVASAGYLIGSRLGPGAPAYHPRTDAERIREDERLRDAQGLGGSLALRELAEEAAGTSLGARAERALLQGAGDTVQRAAARRLFLERHPASWLRRTWAAQQPREPR